MHLIWDFIKGTFAGSLGFCLTAFLLSGCFFNPKGGELGAEPAELRDLNDLLRHAGAAKGIVPAKKSDLDRFQNDYPMGYESVKSGNVLVIWGAKLGAESDQGKGEFPIAYQKSVPEGGGYVLLSSGAVKKMTASDFRSSKK